MNETQRYDMSSIFAIFQEATALEKTLVAFLPSAKRSINLSKLRWESANYYLGQFHDECFKALPHSEQIKR